MTATAPAVNTEPLARLTAAVRRLHAAGWTWSWSTPASGGREHQYDRPGARLFVQLTPDRAEVFVQRVGPDGRRIADLADLYVGYGALGETALVDLITGLPATPTTNGS